MQKLQDPIPIYTIGYGSRSIEEFIDRTLQEMAAQLPQSAEAFRQIHGIGIAKVQKYADVFLSIIRAYCQEHGLMEHNR